ncbi:T9SS type A sorting domain-containing protein [Membranicola marinus]|uniref:T9SS type A sorting domain-containing protein n=1 Tax=Membranihabitans marinus TaxID=1227546 RepID=A0A953HPE7_9BACT|nr:T9SS type A sorting domain-containing protein [Membranihabitans marinus]MBY5958819.1 T9SS type A sorting domain-containing protein [Membranihabitans marinus]
MKILRRKFIVYSTRLFISALTIAVLGLLPKMAGAQVPGCTKFSVGFQSDGQSVITARQLLENEPELPVYLTIRASNHNTIYEGQITDLDADIKLELCGYITKELIYELRNEAGFCSDTLLISIPPPPQMSGRKVEVLCSDALVAPGALIGDTFPHIEYPCGPIPELKVVEDFQEVKDCQNYDQPIQQVIYREIEGYDNWGQRFSTVDTIVVYKQPEITAYHIALDTVYNLYCGENEIFGPQILFENPISKTLDTLPLLKAVPASGRQVEFIASSFASMCNMSVEVNSTLINNTKCVKQYAVQLEFDQECYYADGTRPLASKPKKGLIRMERGRYRASFSVIDIDTLAPVISVEQRVVTSYTGSRGCEASLKVPSMTINEECSGVRRVTASVPGYFTVNLEQNRMGEWVPDENVILPKEGRVIMDNDTIIENAFKVYVEASDSCDLTSVDSFYVRVVDDTKPHVSILQNIRVGLTGELTWIDVSIMDEGSFDNCGVAMVLGRRTDWATAAHVELCDGLETDARVNPVEAHYASFLDDLKYSNESCTNWLYEEWQKDSMRVCNETLPDSLLPQIGGGWTTQIPFTCEDACQEIEVELLVLDNWCNWSTMRTTVKVRDKQPISLVQDLKSSVTMNCSSFTNYYADVVNRASVLNNYPAHDTARIAAFAALDSLMGGYVSVWQDLDGQMTTNDGHNVIPSEHQVIIKKDNCENYTQRKSVEVFDENKGEFVSRMQDVPMTRTVTANEEIENGIVAVNCSSSTYEKIFVDINECGIGTIRRRFYIAAGCGETGSGDWLSKNENRIEYVREQVIYVEPDCELGAGMLDMPAAVSAVDVCEIEKSANGNYIGELHPDFTGWPKYTWDKSCRDLGIGYQDKLFRLFGNNAIGQWKLVRNWKITDQCEDTDDGSVLNYEQILIINELDQCDSAANHYVISGRIQDPGGAPIENVSIRLHDGDDERLAAHSSIQGTYSISADKEQAYKVIPYKNDEMLKGISTFDLVMIQKDILNIKRLDNVYRRIAADINNNGVIDPADIIELRKAILRPDFKFSNNTSYQFRAAGSKSNFGDIENLDQNTNIDFVGIKIGDVNFSASTAVPTSRSRGMNMVLQDQWLQSDVTYRIPVRNNRAMDVLGFQFEWDLNEQDVASVSLSSGSVQVSTEDYAVLDEGKLTVSWFDIDERYFDQGEVLFYINIKTNRRTTLQELIRPSSEVLKTESYVEPGIVKDLSFTFRDMNRSVSHIQNIPNPFKDRTMIRFEQDRAETVVIDVHDVTGKMVLNRRIEGQKGFNEVIISGSELHGPGLYYYRISTSDQQWTNKMIYIR